ncbi:unnamed protein product [Citrullus colocynthis]|uniref:Uncharacterized protein n=1 Tax=Citrullus colocynthis TaxID=252529 RepID=A0ABP0ZCT1_9ROSI
MGKGNKKKKHIPQQYNKVKKKNSLFPFLSFHSLSPNAKSKRENPVLHIAHPTKLSRGSDPLIFSHQPASLFSPPCLKILHSIGEWLVL